MKKTVKELLESLGIRLDEEVVNYDALITSSFGKQAIELTFKVASVEVWTIKKIETNFPELEKSTTYKEIFKLKKMLDENNVKYDSFHKLLDGFQITIKKFDFDVIEHGGSYGHASDLLEIMGLLTKEEAKHDSACGGLTAENVYKRIVKAYKKEGK